MTNIKQFKPAEVAKLLTYEETIKRHLEELTDEEKNQKVSMLLVSGETDRGFVYSVLEGTGVAKALGVLEVVKYSIIEEYY